MPTSAQKSKEVRTRVEVIFRLYQEGVPIPEIATRVGMQQKHLYSVLKGKLFTSHFKALFPDCPVGQMPIKRTHGEYGLSVEQQVEKYLEDGVWVGPRDHRGYPLVSVEGRQVLLWTHLMGERAFPRTLDLNCVNPDELVTGYESLFYMNCENSRGYLRWTGHSRSGYPIMGFGDRTTVRAHRFIMSSKIAASKLSEYLWGMQHGEDLVRHLNHDPLCVDPRYLAIGTYRDNEWDNQFICDDYTTLLLYDDNWVEVCDELGIPKDFAEACRNGDANSHVFRYVFPLTAYRRRRNLGRFCVYIYWEPEDESIIRYVGQGHYDRIYDHSKPSVLARGHNAEFCEWLKTLEPPYPRKRVASKLTKREALTLEAELLEKHKDTVFNKKFNG